MTSWGGVAWGNEKQKAAATRENIWRQNYAPKHGAEGTEKLNPPTQWCLSIIKNNAKHIIGMLIISTT